MTQIPEALGLAPEQVSALLDAARRAPSSHNTQPWLFRLTPTVIELHADLERRLPVADPDGTEMRLACGAALFNLRIAMLGAGIRPTVTLLPDPDQPQLIATGAASRPPPRSSGCSAPFRSGTPTGTPSPTSLSRPSSTPCGAPPSTSAPGCTS